MKKQILILLILSLHFSCGDGEKMDNDLIDQKIRGHVKEITETSFDAKESFGEVKKDGVKNKKEQKFNKSGNITESNKYDENGELTKLQYEYEYDKKKNWTVRKIAYLININLIDSTDEDYKISYITERKITYY